tara:strand:+ start:449 stop:682 length:234 start_codon:yes stop_codon:yes gene_type:complete
MVDEFHNDNTDMQSDDWQPIEDWLFINERNITWLSRRLSLSKQAVHTWKKNKNIPENRKPGIAYALGTSVEMLWGEL